MNKHTKRPATQAIRLYCCCHPKNQIYRDELEEHFSALKRQGQLEIWHSDKMLAGVVQDQEIDTHFSSADIILLFISHYFFSSNECWKIMERALVLHNAGKVFLAPILVSPVDYEATAIGKLQVLPRRRPLSRFTDRNEGYVEIVKGVRAIMEQIQANVEEIYEQTTATDTQYIIASNNDSATSLSPSHFIAKGDILTEQQRYTDAISLYDRAIHLDPNCTLAYKGKAQALELLAKLVYQKLNQLAVQSFEIEQQQNRIQEDLEI